MKRPITALTARGTKTDKLVVQGSQTSSAENFGAKIITGEVLPIKIVRKRESSKRPTVKMIGERMVRETINNWGKMDP